MEEVVKQKKDKTELVRKLSLSNSILVFGAILFGLLGIISFRLGWRIGSLEVVMIFAFPGIAMALAAVVIAILIGVFFLKFQVNHVKMKNKTLAILNIVLACSVIVFAALALLIGGAVWDMFVFIGIGIVMLIGIALGVIDILIYVWINKNKNPKV